MKTYSDGVLATMLADPESDRVERKESLKGGAPQAGRHRRCAPLPTIWRAMASQVSCSWAWETTAQRLGLR